MTSCVDPLDWFPKNVSGLGWMKRQPARAKIIAVFLDINDNSPLSQPLLKVDEV